MIINESLKKTKNVTLVRTIVSSKSRKIKEILLT
jgi:hypothetical protein